MKLKLGRIEMWKIEFTEQLGVESIYILHSGEGERER